MNGLATVVLVITLLASGLYIFEKGASATKSFSGSKKQEGGKSKTSKRVKNNNKTKKN